MNKSEQLRALADFCDLHPVLLEFLFINNKVYVYDNSALLLKFAKLPGARKLFELNDIVIKVPIDTTTLASSHLQLEVIAARSSVCTPTKFETIEEPARAAYTYEKPVEWNCHPLLASIKDEE